jgi:hypothetical protein
MVRMIRIVCGGQWIGEEAVDWQKRFVALVKFVY